MLSAIILIIGKIVSSLDFEGRQYGDSFNIADFCIKRKTAHIFKCMTTTRGRTIHAHHCETDYP